MRGDRVPIENSGDPTGFVAVVLSSLAVGWSIFTGKRQDRRESDEERARKAAARKEEIREESIRAVEGSGKFVMRLKQDAVNDRILFEVAETKDAVKSLNDKLDQILLAGRLDIKRRD